MKQKRMTMIKKWISSIFWVIAVFLLVRYGFLLAFWLTTPKECGLKKQEFTLLEGIKKEMKINKISRDARSKPLDTASYKLFISGINCEKWHYQQLRYESDRIKKEIDRLHLNKKFYKYVLVYRCENGENVQFNYLR